MIVHIESDAAYISEPKARSRAAGYFYLSNRVTENNQQPMMNGPIHVVCVILKEICPNAAETEFGLLFRNGKEAVPSVQTLKVLYHAQPEDGVRIVTDNSTTTGIASDTVKQQRSKAVATRYYCIRDRVTQGQHRIVWQAGQRSRGDMVTKRHPPFYYHGRRAQYFQEAPRNLHHCLHTCTIFQTTG
jgi:hypothetical protein